MIIDCNYKLRILQVWLILGLGKSCQNNHLITHVIIAYPRIS